MLYMLAGRVTYKTRGAAKERFLETGGQPPPGVSIAARFHGLDGRVWTIAETDDPIVLGRWIDEWADLFDQDVIPVLTSEDMAKTLAP